MTATDDEIKEASDWKADLNEYLSDPTEAREVIRLWKEKTSPATPEDEAIITEAKAVASKTISSIRAERTESLRKLVDEAGPHLQPARVPRLDGRRGAEARCPDGQ
jgi:hypothetical protein